MNRDSHNNSLLFSHHNHSTFDHNMKHVNNGNNESFISSESSFSWINSSHGGSSHSFPSFFHDLDDDTKFVKKPAVLPSNHKSLKTKEQNFLNRRKIESSREIKLDQEMINHQQRLLDYYNNNRHNNNSSSRSNSSSDKSKTFRRNSMRPNSHLYNRNYKGNSKNPMNCKRFNDRDIPSNIYVEQYNRADDVPRDIFVHPHNTASDNVSTAMASTNHHHRKVNYSCSTSVDSTISSKKTTATRAIETCDNHRLHHQQQQRPPLDNRCWLEIIPGKLMPFHGSAETENALMYGRTKSVTCIDCFKNLLCIDDATMVICPYCKSISPVAATIHNGNSPVTNNTATTGTYTHDRKIILQGSLGLGIDPMML